MDTLKASVRHDLEWLLNTRRIPDEAPESFQELTRSLYHFGFPDITSMGRDSKEVRTPAPQAGRGDHRHLRAPARRGAGVADRNERRRQAAAALSDRGDAAHGAESRASGLRHGARDLAAASTGSRETAVRDDLLYYYERELTFLRRMGAEFAGRYPKVASRLQLEPDKCEDPHIERLLEGFAFLAARVHLKIDDDFPEITEAFLNVVYPHYIRPLPAMSLVEFQLDPEQGKLTTGYRIPRDTLMYSRPVGGVPCKFKSCYDTTLWPLTVSAAQWQTPDRLSPPVKDLEASAAFRLEFQCLPGTDVREARARVASAPSERRRQPGVHALRAALQQLSPDHRPRPDAGIEAQAGASAGDRAPPGRVCRGRGDAPVSRAVVPRLPAAAGVLSRI